MPSSARYTALPNAVSDRDPLRINQELNDAFESDDEDHENTPLTHTNDDPTTAIPGAYDFERDRAYDRPPPGSPPAPSSRALPNDIGNSNGLLPSSPLAPPRQPRRTRGGFFRRAVGALLPSHYVQVPTEESTSRTVVGAGIENDGVFANVTAKPQAASTRAVEGEDGSIYMVPEDTTQKDVPPSYTDAQLDSVPPYFETTVHALSASGAPFPTDPTSGDMIIDDLPTGSVWIFALNLFISYFFQFVGFLFTYLLHTSHAAKFGSRAGLGLTLIQFGFYSRSGGDSDSSQDDAAKASGLFATLQANWSSNITETMNALAGNSSSISNSTLISDAPAPDDLMLPMITAKDWLALLFMTLGWFIFLTSVLGYARTKRWEHSVRAASDPSRSRSRAQESESPASTAPPTVEAIERDIAIRRNIASVFGVAFEQEEEEALQRRRLEVLQERDARLTRDLQAAGLL
ncbi:hypothetical protein DXG03_008596 [Asterophora parasitica]|uniref:Metal homeostatis protein bsd2 n=1 Tax=Asterophora parasitica TaxID=117018 RepID=A0A9P7KBC0_9AGAR|nr:hypothetical protein DXG03_008596 [Asterophora parasitica]